MKKKALLFSIGCVMITLIILIDAYVVLKNKTNIVGENKPIGDKQLNLIQTYQKAEKALFYIDQSAKYSAYESIKELGLNSGFKIKPDCEEYENTIIWKNTFDSEKCFPNNLNKSFEDYFKGNFEQYIALNHYTTITIDDYFFDINYKDNLSIKGISMININFDVKESEKSIYSITPNFKTELNYNLKEKYKEYKNKAESAATRIITCLAYGGLDETEENDLEETCSKHTSVENVVESAEDQPGQFYIMFNIKDNDLILQPLEIKFAYLLKDDIPPPKTTGLKTKKIGSKNILEWSKNRASDTKAYNIYYKKDNDFTSIEKAIFLAKTINLEYEIDLPGKKYYFAVTAVDEAGNELKEVSAIVINT